MRLQTCHMCQKVKPLTYTMRIIRGTPGNLHPQVIVCWVVQKLTIDGSPYSGVHLSLVNVSRRKTK